jgi:hypothetical protein
MRHIKVVTFDEVRETFLRLYEKGADSLGIKRSDNLARMKSWEASWRSGSDFAGGRMADMVGYLHHGYQIPGLQLEPSLAPVRKRRKITFNDMEGDFQYDLFRSGFDFPYMTGTPREVTPAMDYELDCTFSGGINASEVTAYTSWNLKALIALETAGIGCDVFISNRVTNPFKAKNGGTFGDAELRVKVANADGATDFLDWSAIFAPGGYRMLIFMMKLLHADELGYGLSEGVGSPMTPDRYGVKFREDDRVIHARIGKLARFNEATMDEDFRLCLELAKD